MATVRFAWTAQRASADVARFVPEDGSWPNHPSGPSTADALRAGMLRHRSMRIGMESSSGTARADRHETSVRRPGGRVWTWSAHDADRVEGRARDAIEKRKSPKAGDHTS